MCGLWNNWRAMRIVLWLIAGASLTGCSTTLPAQAPAVPPAALLREGPPLPDPRPVHEAIRGADTEERRWRAALRFALYVSEVSAAHARQNDDKRALRAFFGEMNNDGH